MNRYTIVGAATAAALLIGLTQPAYAETPATSHRVHSTPASTAEQYTAALQELPAAYTAIDTAKQDAYHATTLIAEAQANIDVARTAAGDALLEKYRARQVSVLADATARAASVEAEARRNEIDDMARAMYISGGTPSTIETILTATTKDNGLTRSLDTQQYLKTASLTTVAVAEQARDRAFTSGIAADNARTDAAVATQTADTELANLRAAVQARGRAVVDAQRAHAAIRTAQAHYQRLMMLTSVNPIVQYKDPGKCGDWLVKLLAKAGFQGEDLHEAWAIAMRESGGREDAISATNDLGIFQINTATYQDQPWFNRDLLLTREYNVAIGYQLSQGGNTWYPWGLDGHGRVDAQAYINSGWSEQKIQDHIVLPYIHFYSTYPCSPGAVPPTDGLEG